MYVIIERTFLLGSPERTGVQANSDAGMLHVVIKYNMVCFHYSYFRSINGTRIIQSCWYVHVCVYFKMLLSYCTKFTSVMLFCFQLL